MLVPDADEAMFERDVGRSMWQGPRVYASGWPAWNVACRA